jgi:hypothetical protein
MKTRFLVRDGEVVEVPLPAPDFADLEAAVKAVPKSDDLVDSAGHPIGNYL